MEEFADEEQVVVFKLGNVLYGLNIFQVKEIIRFTEVTSVPSVPDFVEGIINLRSKIIPILDLKKSFQLESAEVTQNTRIVIVEIGGQVLGLIVDGVEEVLRVKVNAIEMPPALTGVMAQCVKGVGKVEDKLLIVLELEKLVTQEEIKDLAAVG